MPPVAQNRGHRSVDASLESVVEVVECLPHVALVAMEGVGDISRSDVALVAGEPVDDRGE